LAAAFLAAYAIILSASCSKAAASRQVINAELSKRTGKENNLTLILVKWN
jgi:hypothetical protein